jgi:hypothetical protein
VFAGSSKYIGDAIATKLSHAFWKKATNSYQHQVMAKKFLEMGSVRDLGSIMVCTWEELGF